MSLTGLTVRASAAMKPKSAETVETPTKAIEPKVIGKEAFATPKTS